jgi:hypothetical protein
MQWLYICCIDMTHKEILTAFRNGNTKVALTCHITREEYVCTILRAGAKQIHVALSPNYVQQYENRGDVNYDYQMLRVIYEGA